MAHPSFFFKSLAAAAALLLAVACSSSDVVRAPVDVTIGQQLIDLKKAHTAGALSDAEYVQQKRKLIEAAQ